MTDDLFSQLRAYGEQIDHERTPVTLTEVTHSRASVNGVVTRTDLPRPPAPGDDYEEIDIMLMKKEQQQQPSRTQSLVLAAAAAVLIACVFAISQLVASDGSDVSTDTETPVTEPDSSQSTSTPPTTTSTTPVPAGEEIPSFGAVPADTTYRTELLDRPVTFFMPEPLEVSSIRENFMAFHADGQGAENYGVILERFPEFFAAVTSAELADWPEEGIDANDLDAWIADAKIIVSDDRATSVDGRPARAIDFVVDPSAAFPDVENPPCEIIVRPCYFYSTAIERNDGTANRLNVLLNHLSYRMIHVPIADEDPVVILLWSVGSTTVDKIDAFETGLVDTLTIG